MFGDHRVRSQQRMVELRSNMLRQQLKWSVSKELPRRRSNSRFAIIIDNKQTWTRAWEAEAKKPDSNHDLLRKKFGFGLLYSA